MLPSSGKIEFADINKELERPSSSLIDFNDSLVRDLCDKPSGVISLYDFKGKKKKVNIAKVIINLVTHIPDGTVDESELDYFRCWNSSGELVVERIGGNWGGEQHRIEIVPIGGFCLDIAKIEFRHKVPALPRYLTFYPVIIVESLYGDILQMISEPIDDSDYSTDGLFKTFTFMENVSPINVRENNLPVRF